MDPACTLLCFILLTVRDGPVDFKCAPGAATANETCRLTATVISDLLVSFHRCYHCCAGAFILQRVRLLNDEPSLFRGVSGGGTGYVKKMGAYRCVAGEVRVFVIKF